MLVQIAYSESQLPAGGIKKLENTPQNRDETIRIPAELGSSGQAQKS